MTRLQEVCLENSPAHNPPAKPQIIVFTVWFLHELNKQDINVVSFRGAGRQILLPLDATMLAVSLCF